MPTKKTSTRKTSTKRKTTKASPEASSMISIKPRLSPERFREIKELADFVETCLVSHRKMVRSELNSVIAGMHAVERRVDIAINKRYNMSWKEVRWFLFGIVFPLLLAGFLVGYWVSQ